MRQANPWDIVAGVLVCLLIFLAVYLIIYILFLLNLQRTLNAVSHRNRELSPGLVWLSLIPIFNLIWNPLMVPKIANSRRNEFEDRGWPTSGDGFGRVTGLLWAWGGVVSVFLNFGQRAAQAADVLPVAMVLGLAGCPVAIGILVSWIMFWVQTYQYRNRLEYGGGRYRRGPGVRQSPGIREAVRRRAGRRRDTGPA